MPAVRSKDPCTICLQNFSVMHSHHTVPRSCGGENSLQIILCSNCHNVLHANGLAIAASIRSGKKIRKEYWPNSEQRSRAEPYLQILVRALLADAQDKQREHLVSTQVPTEVFEMMKLLKLDIGASSMEKTLEYCIRYTLHSKGIVSNAKNTKTLWFMRIPES